MVRACRLLITGGRPAFIYFNAQTGLPEISNNVGPVKSFFCFFLKFLVTFFLFRAHHCVHSEEWSSVLFLTSASTTTARS